MPFKTRWILATYTIRVLCRRGNKVIGMQKLRRAGFYGCVQGFGDPSPVYRTPRIEDQLTDESNDGRFAVQPKFNVQCLRRYTENACRLGFVSSASSQGLVNRLAFGVGQ